MTKVTELAFVNHNNLIDVSGLENLVSLEKLALYCRHLNDISLLSKLKKLKCLEIELNNGSNDTKILSEMVQLESLSLNEIKLHDLYFLEKLTNLKILNLSAVRHIEDYSMLKRLKNIKIILDGSCLEDYESRKSFIEAIKRDDLTIDFSDLF